MEDIDRVKRGFPNIDFRIMVLPRAELAGGFVPIYDGVDVVEKFLALGFKDGTYYMD